MEDLNEIAEIVAETTLETEVVSIGPLGIIGIMSGVGLAIGIFSWIFGRELMKKEGRVERIERIEKIEGRKRKRFPLKGKPLHQNAKNEIARMRNEENDSI